MTAALANPYAQTYGMSPHYYQAYMQALHNRPHPASTAEGYTLSSTYVPHRRSFRIPTNQPLLSPSETHVPLPPTPDKRGIPNPLTYGSWYQPGNVRCQRQGCPFLGSHKSVEIHMMDRHFIFPPGWQKHKDDWDTDPSLKGSVYGASWRARGLIRSIENLFQFRGHPSCWIPPKLLMRGWRSVENDFRRQNESTRKNARWKKP